MIGRTSRRVSPLVACLFAVGVIAAPCSVIAQPVFRAGVAAGANPRVVATTLGASWPVALYPHRSGILWDSARVEPRVEVQANPSFSDISLGLYVEPVVLVDLTLRAGVRTFYDDFGLGIGGLATYAERGPSARGASYAGADAKGTFLTVAPRLKAGVGPVLATNTVNATRYEFTGVDDRRIEEPVSLATIRPTDWVVSNEAVVLYRFDAPRLYFAAAGVTWRAVTVPAAPRSEQPTSHRLAALGVIEGPLTARLTLQLFANVGIYVNGEPVPRERPLALTAVNLIYRR